MKRLRVDYDAIAPDYDRHRRADGAHFAPLRRLAAAAKGPRFLDAGAGTGNVAALLREARPDARIVALEASAGMLAAGRGKGLGRWIRGRAEQLPFADARFDFVSASYLLHHLHPIGAFFQEARRVLDGGALALVTVPEGFIDAHPMNAYFPSFASVDRARFPALDAVEAGLRAAGFGAVRREVVVDPPKPVDAAYVEKIAARFISTYALLPEEEFTAGLAALRRDVAAGADLAIRRETATIWGVL